MSRGIAVWPDAHASWMGATVREAGEAVAPLAEADALIWYGGAADLAGRHLREGQACLGPCLPDGPRTHCQPREPAALAAGLLADYHTGCQPNSQST